MRTLDRKRKFDTSYGDTNARYLQDGIWFDPQGQEINSEGVTANSAEPVERATTQVVGRVREPVAPGTTAVSPIASQLGPLNAAQVKSIFRKAGGPEDLTKGEGARGRMVEWLIANGAAPAPQ